MSTALRCTPYAPSRRVPSNRHRKAVAPPATLKLKSTQLSIIATANVSEETPEGSYHSSAGAIGSLGAPVAFDEVVPGAGVEPACRNYPARDFKTGRADCPQQSVTAHSSNMNDLPRPTCCRLRSFAADNCARVCQKCANARGPVDRVSACVMG